MASEGGTSEVEFEPIGPADVIYKMRRLNLIVKRDFERRAQMLQAIEDKKSGKTKKVAMTSRINQEFAMPDFAGIRIDTVVGCVRLDLRAD